MKQTIRLTEANLRNMIQEAVEDAINNGELDEGFWNQLKTGANTFMNNDKGSGRGFVDNMKTKWNAAKKNYQTQGQIDQMDNLKSEMQNVQSKLQQMLNSGLLTPQTTVEQILSNQTQWNSFSGKHANLKSQLSRRGYKKPTA